MLWYVESFNEKERKVTEGDYWFTCDTGDSQKYTNTMKKKKSTNSWEYGSCQLREYARDDSQEQRQDELFQVPPDYYEFKVMFSS